MLKFVSMVVMAVVLQSCENTQSHSIGEYLSTTEIDSVCYVNTSETPYNAEDPSLSKWCGNKSIAILAGTNHALPYVAAKYCKIGTIAKMDYAVVCELK